jgi:hypothetical protein
MNERPSKYDLPYTKFQKMLRAYRRSFPDRGEGRWGGYRGVECGECWAGGACANTHAEARGTCGSVGPGRGCEMGRVGESGRCRP